MTKARDLANASTALSAVSATELGYLDGVTSAIQTQFSNISGSKADPTEPTSPTDGMIWIDTDGSVTDAQYIAKDVITTTGDIIYASGANTPARLGIGSSAQVLTVSGGVPAWAAPAGGGKLLQLVSATYSTETDLSTTTYTDSGLTASITPTSATSKIYVQITAPFFKNASNAANGVKYRILRGATAIATWPESDLATGTATTNSGTFGLLYVDSPATTSATTYKLQFANVSATSFVRICSGGSLATIQLLEIGA
jgi:hypothetical protein